MEARNEKNQAAATPEPAEEGWIEVPSKRSKKKEGSPQTGKQGAKTGGQGGRGGNNQVHQSSKEDDEQRRKWAAIEEELKPKVVVGDSYDWSLNLAVAAKKSPEPQAPQAGQAPSNTWSKVLFGGKSQAQAVAQPASNKPLSLIGGAHVSYYKNIPKKKDFAVASFVVCSFPALEVVYEAVKEMHVDAPFISGFHSFRDTIPLVALFDELKATKPELVPQIIFVDGPGVLYKGFGLATHLGVLLDIPTIGVTKKFFNVDGLNESNVRKFVAQELQKRGEAIEIIGRNSGSVLGAAMRTTEGARGNYAYISVGHRISLPSAVEVVREACTGKIPQPVFTAEQKVKLELAKTDPKSKKPLAPAGKAAGGNNRRQGGAGKQGGKKEGVKGQQGGKPAGAVTNGKAQEGKGQGKRGPRAPRPQGEGQQGGPKGPRQGQPGQGQGGQGGQAQGQGGQGGQGGQKRPGGGPRGGSRPQGGNVGSPKTGNVWTQKAPTSTPAAGAPAAVAPATQAAAPATTQQPQQPQQQQQRPAGGKQNNNKGGQQKQGGQPRQQGAPGQKKQQPAQGEKSGEKQAAPEASEKKD